MENPQLSGSPRLQRHATRFWRPDHPKTTVVERRITDPARPVPFLASKLAESKSNDRNADTSALPYISGGRQHQRSHAPPLSFRLYVFRHMASFGCCTLLLSLWSRSHPVGLQMGRPAAGLCAEPAAASGQPGGGSAVDPSGRGGRQGTVRAHPESQKSYRRAAALLRLQRSLVHGHGPWSGL